MDSEILIGIATLGLTLTGFSGLVAVLGRRGAGQWREGEKVQFVELAVISLSVTFGAFIPILMATAFSSDLSLRLSLGLITAVHIGVMTHGLLSVRRSAEVRDEYGSGVIAFLFAGGILIVGGSVSTTIGFTGGYELLILLNLVWLLFVAVVNFVQLLTSAQDKGE